MNIWREIIREWMSRFPPPMTDPKNVLIVKIDNIGDFVLFSRFLPFFRKRFPSPEFRIFLLGNVVWEDLAKWINTHRIVSVGEKLYPLFDDFIRFERRGIKKIFVFYRFLKELRERKVYYSFYPTYSREEFGDIFSLTCGASERVTFSGDCVNIKKKILKRNNKKYTRLIECEEPVVREIDRIKMFVEKALEISIPESLSPSWRVSDGAFSMAKRVMREVGMEVGEPFAIVVPGSDAPFRRWPLERFTEICLFLLESRKVERIVVVGNEKEKGLGEKMVASSGEKIIDFTAKTDLPMLASLISRAKLVIGNETGPIHMASALGIPVVCIMGGGHFGRFFPYGDPGKNVAVYQKMDCFGCNWVCIYTEDKQELVPCIERVRVEQVIKAIESLKVSE